MIGYCDNTRENPVGVVSKNKKIRDRVDSEGQRESTVKKKFL